MKSFSKQLDRLLLDLAWSLWTEVGVAGVKKKHRDVLISLEELVVLTAVLAEADPRLRDESLDWCCHYGKLVSISRLKSIAKDMGALISAPLSKYSATLNALAGTKWPLFIKALPWKIAFNHKACLRPLGSPSLLNIRARSLFGGGSRADLVTFFLTHKQSDFAISDLAELGYSKRSLAEILEGLSASGLLEKHLLRNQFRYRLAKNAPLAAILSPIPSYAPSWLDILKILLPIRSCTKDNEKKSESTQLAKIRHLLVSMQEQLQKLKLSPPSFQGDISSYLKAFKEWVLGIASVLAHGKFPSASFLKRFH